jgi:hypothetical protein
MRIIEDNDEALDFFMMVAVMDRGDGSAFFDMRFLSFAAWGTFSAF